MKYPIRFEAGERRVFLKGEAYFEVKSDRKNPFVVATDNMDIVATDTAFSVEAYSNDTMTSVTLAKGIVNLNFEEKSILLKQGEKMTHNSVSSKYNINETDTYKWYSWKDGIIAFRNDPLEYVFKRLGQTYNINFIIKDEELKKHVYHATFEDESLDEILDLLQVSIPIY